MWDLSPDVKISLEAGHREHVSNPGALNAAKRKAGEPGASLGSTMRCPSFPPSTFPLHPPPSEGLEHNGLIPGK